VKEAFHVILMRCTARRILSYSQHHFGEEEDSAAGKPLSTDQAAGCEGRFIVGEVVDEAVGELCREICHEVVEGDDGGGRQEIRVSPVSQSIVPSDGRIAYISYAVFIVLFRPSVQVTRDAEL
jgi:hypothetical protein